MYSFWGTDPREILAAFRNIEPIYFIPVVVGILGMPVVRSLRLKYILDLEHKVTQRRIFAIYNVGQLLNQVLPALTGQVGRVILFARTLGITKTFAFTMVILEVLFDGLTLLMLIFGASTLIVMPQWMLRGEAVILIACIALFAFFYFALHRRGREPNPNSWFRRHAPQRLIQEWDNARTSFLAGLNMLRSARHLVVVILLSIVSWLSHALVVFFLLHAFGFEFELWVALVVLIVNTLAIMIPVTPGNIGTLQFACIVGLGFFGVPKDTALGFSLLLHAAEIVPVFALGAISSFSSHVRVSEFRTPDALAEQEQLAREFDHLPAQRIRWGPPPPIPGNEGRPGEGQP